MNIYVHTICICVFVIDYVTKEQWVKGLNPYGYDENILGMVVEHVSESDRAREIGADPTALGLWVFGWAYVIGVWW